MILVPTGTNLSKPRMFVPVSGSAVDPAEALLAGAVGWWEARGFVSGQTVANKGTGGSALDLTRGSSGSSDSNDPTFLAHGGATYLNMTGANDAGVSVPDAANLTPTGDFTLIVEGDMGNWTPAAFSALLTKWNNAADAEWYLGLNTNGTLHFALYDTNIANNVTANSTVAVGQSGRWAVGARVDVSTGEVTFLSGASATSLSTLGTVVDTGGALALTGTALPVRVGRGGASQFPATGKVYRAMLLDENDATVLDINFTTASGAASFTCATGQTVTVHGSSRVVAEDAFNFTTDDYLRTTSGALAMAANQDFTVIGAIRYRPYYNIAGATTAHPNAGGFMLGMNYDGNGGPLRFRVDDGLGNGAAAGFGATPADDELIVIGGQVNRTAQEARGIRNSTVGGTASSTSSVGALPAATGFAIGAASNGAALHSDFRWIATAVFNRLLTQDEIDLIVGRWT